MSNNPRADFLRLEEEIMKLNKKKRKLLNELQKAHEAWEATVDFTTPDNKARGSYGSPLLDPNGFIVSGFPHHLEG